jgi:uncharacterized protein YndB with AHSA1/START domain
MRPAADPAPPPAELRLTRVLAAPRALVFKAWTEPAHLVRWWGPHGFTVPACRLDPRPGGGFRIHMRSGTGADHWAQGRYDELVPPERLVCAWAWTDAAGTPLQRTVLTVTFEEHAAGTLLTLHQAPFVSVADRDGHADGWSQALSRLAAVLEAAAAAG